MKGLTMPKDDATLSAASVGSAMRYASVCDGIGAAHVAWQPLGWQCQWTSEIEPFPAAVVEHHYGFRNLGDMTAITEEMLDAPVELLVGGTPCQSFSVAGLRGGLADPRGNLALRFVQLAAVMQPKWIVWENVPGVLSSGKGRDFGTFLGALGELGYGFAYRILDAQWHGVAQRRRRVFVVGYLGDWRRAAAVLFERESVFGNPPTRGKAWEGVARSTAASLTSSGRGVERCGESRGQDDVVLAAPQVANPLTARMGKGINTTCDEGQTPVIAFGGQMSTPQVDTELSQTLQRKNPQAVVTPIDLRQASRGEKIANNRSSGSGGPPGHGVGDGGDPAFTVSERGQAVATTFDWQAGGGGSDQSFRGKSRSYIVDKPECSRALTSCKTLAVAFTAKDCGGDASQDVAPTMRAMGHSGSHANGGGQLAVAVDTYNQSVGDVSIPLRVGNAKDSLPAAMVPQGFTYSGYSNQPAWMTGDRTDCLPASGHSDGSHQGVGVATAMAVRRLTPRECERLQGFPDDYTLVEYRKKPAADAPRYRALGNSMAVPVMRWIGERIQQVDRL
jgi:DNA (cytosine-5)-methyltransferase 1